MNIAFCDDQEPLLDTLCNQIKNIINEKNIYGFEFEYYKYTDPQQLLEDHKKLNFDIAFLDIEMPEISGFDLGDKIFLLNENIFIFYLTSYGQYIGQSIKHRVYRFVEKGDKKELEDGIKAMFSDLVFRKSKYIFMYGRNRYILPLMSIDYFEADKNLVNIFAEEKIYKQRITVKELLESLPDVFCQCHVSFIVNIKNIVEIHSDGLLMRNNKILPVGKKYRPELYHRIIRIENETDQNN